MLKPCTERRRSGFNARVGCSLAVFVLHLSVTCMVVAGDDNGGWDLFSSSPSSPPVDDSADARAIRSMQRDSQMAARGVQRGYNLEQSEQRAMRSVGSRAKRIESQFAQTSQQGFRQQQQDLPQEDNLSPADRAEDREEKRLLWQAEEAAKNAAVAEQVAEAASDDDNSARSSMMRAGRSAEFAAHAAAREQSAITHRAQTQLQQDSEQAGLLGEASLDADMVDWERQRARAERQQARGYAGGGEGAGRLASEKTRQAHEATQLELSDLGRAQDALGGLQDGGEGGGSRGEREKRHVAEKPLVNPFAIMQDPRDAQRCMQECLKDCADECALEQKSAPGAPCSLDCGQECTAMCPGGAPYLQGSAHGPPSMDHSRSAAADSVPRVPRHDRMLPDSFSQDQEVSDGRPGPVLEDRAPKVWAQDVDEDPDEPSDGSGKAVQPETPMVGRVMDKTCVDDCLPPCTRQCPLKGGDQHVCTQECSLRCEDDCYIDEAGGPPSPPTGPPPSSSKLPPASTGDPLMDAMLGRGGAPKPPAPQEELNEMESNAQRLMQGCVGRCVGECVPHCLSAKQLQWLPAKLSAQHLQRMRQNMSPQAADAAVKGHVACEGTCLDRCFPACEQSVASKIQAQFGAEGEEGAGAIPGGGANVGRGRGRPRQNGYAPYTQDTDGEGNVIIPTETPPSPFSSMLWRGVLGVVLLGALLACLLRSGIFRKKGRPGVGMSNF